MNAHVSPPQTVKQDPSPVCDIRTLSSIAEEILGHNPEILIDDGGKDDRLYLYITEHIQLRVHNNPEIPYSVWRLQKTPPHRFDPGEAIYQELNCYDDFEEACRAACHHAKKQNRSNELATLLQKDFDTLHS